MKNIATNSVFIVFLWLISLGVNGGRGEDIEGIASCIYPTAQFDEKQENLRQKYIKNLKDDLPNDIYTDQTIQEIRVICEENFSLPKDMPTYKIGDQFFVWLNVRTLFDPDYDLSQQRDDIFATISKLNKEHRAKALNQEIKERSDPTATAQKKAQQQELDVVINNYVPTYNKDYILKNMSVNLVWTYKELDPAHTYIFPVPYVRQNVSIDLFQRIAEWAALYPKVVIWYDSRYVTPDAINRTRAKIDDAYKDIASKVELKGIRILSHVKEHEAVFDHGSIYFRADLLRLVMSYEELKQAQKGHFLLYADLGITPLNHDELLDKLTVMNLNEFGVVLATKKGSDRHENSFHIMGNHHEALLRALKAAVIDLNIKRVGNDDFLNSGRYTPGKQGDDKYHQVVYDSYQGFIRVLYGLLKKSDEIVCGSTWDKKSDQELNECLWKEYGVQVSSSSDHLGAITDTFLKLRIALNKSWYFPILYSDKFTRSHFG